MTMEDYVTLWSKTLGVEGRLVVGSMEELPPDLKQEFEEMIAFMAEFGYFGEKAGAPLTYPKDVSNSNDLAILWLTNSFSLMRV